jgi:hypothetical protein
MWKLRSKTIFEDDFQHLIDPTYMIIMMVEYIDKCVHYPLNIRQCDTISLFGKDLEKDGLSLTVMEPTTILWI